MIPNNNNNSVPSNFGVSNGENRNTQLNDDGSSSNNNNDNNNTPTFLIWLIIPFIVLSILIPILITRCCDCWKRQHSSHTTKAKVMNVFDNGKVNSGQYLRSDIEGWSILNSPPIHSSSFLSSSSFSSSSSSSASHITHDLNRHSINQINPSSKEKMTLNSSNIPSEFNNDHHDIFNEMVQEMIIYSEQPPKYDIAITDPIDQLNFSQRSIRH